MKKYIPYVNICQGTKSVMRFSNGNTLPLVQRPFGMVSFAPQTDGNNQWWFYPDTPVVEGIRLTHQFSPWVRDYGTILITPQADKISDEMENAWSSYRRSDAIMRPDYMKIKFLRQNCTFEITPTDRSACVRVRFEKDWERAITIFNLLGNAEFEIRDGMVFGTTDGESKAGIANNFKMYFVIKPEHEWIGDCRIVAKDDLKKAIHIGVLDGVMECNFSIATSYISFEQALVNLEETDGGFEKTLAKSEEVWEAYLSRFAIDADEKTMRTFYSCLYRTGLFPHKAYEVTKDGKDMHYSPYKGIATPGKRYSDSCFWDSFRTSFPLFSLIEKDVYRDFLEGALCDYYECGYLPRCLSPGEVGCMPSTLIDSIIAQGAVCKIADGELLFELLSAMKHHSNVNAGKERFGRCGAEDYVKLGYVPCDKYKESVNLTLDFAYGDYCIGKICEVTGDNDTQKYYERGKNYRNIFDTDTKFMRGKTTDGTWRDGFDPYEWGRDYTEASAWQTTMSVPHDLAGLCELYGGKSEILKRMDEIFSNKPVFRVGGYPGEIHEMSEMASADLGLCAISNQPSFLLPFIYAYFGETEKTEKWVEKICDTVFSYEDDGFPGDEDTGSMSAWYIFAKLGIYPVCPADDLWVKFKESVSGFVDGKPIEEWKREINDGI